MAIQVGTLKKNISIGSKGKLPSKTTINLVQKDAKSINWLIAIPAIIVIIAVAALIAKVAVVDRLAELEAIRNENASIQRRIDEYNAQILSYADVQEEYYHYTYTGMNSEERNRTDRVEIIELMDKYVLPKSNVDSWTIYGNVLTTTMSDISLKVANEIVADIESDPLVNYCTLTTATTDNSYDEDIIKANMTVYLNGPVDLEGGAD